MSFRTSDFLQRYEFVQFSTIDNIQKPANGQRQMKSGYRFTVNDRSSFLIGITVTLKSAFSFRSLLMGQLMGPIGYQ